MRMDVDGAHVMTLRKISKALTGMEERYHTIPPVPREVWRNPFYFIAFGFGSGAVPFAPGTFGTLMAIPFYLILSLLPLSAYLIFTVGFMLFSSWLCDCISRETGTHDHPGMCIDEFVGFFVTMIAAPAGWQWIAVGFILFRLFDIWKPWPISYADKNIHGGFGMVFDDVLAGLYAMIVMQTLYYFC
jgi:phosphatidylglycerophosphatase A